MSLVSVETFVIRDHTQGHLDLEDGGLPDRPYDLDEFGRFYPAGLEALLVRLETTDGDVAWGEAQAPAAPEAVQTIIDRLLGPYLLRRENLDPVATYDAMVDAMAIRGHAYGFYADAVAALDVALWDLHGKRHGSSVATLVGGRQRDVLPAYYSGLRESDPEARREAAVAAIDRGFTGVKLYLREDPATEREQLVAMRDRVGPKPELFTDLFWAYELPAAVRLGRTLADIDAGWMEAPLAPLALRSHARLAEQVTVPIAVGEPFRTAAEFARWIDRGALSVAQPDIPRTGITEGRRIADMLRREGITMAPHLGGSFGIGMAATWQLAAAQPEPVIQEHQERWYRASEGFLDGLDVEGGSVNVPDGPGLGLTIDRDAVEDRTESSVRIER